MAKLGKPRTSKGLAQFAAKCADEKLARNIIIIDLQKIEAAPADFFVVCSTDSEVQSRAIVDELIRNCSKTGMKKPRIEGLQTSSWILMDFFDVVLHVMIQKTREFYKLEKLWSDATFSIMTPEGKLKAFAAKDLNSLYTA